MTLARGDLRAEVARACAQGDGATPRLALEVEAFVVDGESGRAALLAQSLDEIGRASCRERVCQYV